jgi:hypothetical protein
MTAAPILIVVLISGAALTLWLDRRAVRRQTRQEPKCE